MTAGGRRRAHEQAEIGIVGGGPAGAALAARLAAAGHETVVFERLRRPRWRAAGVYSSPLTRRRLELLGLSTEQLERLIQPINAMVLQTIDGETTCRLEYPRPESACGLDRVRLEEALLDHARAAGAEVCEGTVVHEVQTGKRPRLLVSQPGNPSTAWQLRLLVGADGPASLVARAAGLTLPVRRFRRAGLTVHRRDPGGVRTRDSVAEAHMLLGDGWYCGIAPVPGERVNIGLVIAEDSLRQGLRAHGSVDAVLRDALRRMPAPHARWADAPPTDSVEVRLPLAHRVRAAARPSLLLVGDAAGFVDPLSGEGLHRALVSAELAASAVEAWSNGDRYALSDYDQRLRARFRSKDFLSWLLQLFLFDPRLGRYAVRRLAGRPPAARRFALGLADLLPASALLDPRFIARLLAG